jgi:hypothetical protein
MPKFQLEVASVPKEQLEDQEVLLSLLEKTLFKLRVLAQVEVSLLLQEKRVTIMVAITLVLVQCIRPPKTA